MMEQMVTDNKGEISQENFTNYFLRKLPNVPTQAELMARDKTTDDLNETAEI